MNPTRSKPSTTYTKVASGLKAEIREDSLTLNRWASTDGQPGELGDFALSPEEAIALVAIVERHKAKWGCKACQGRGVIQTFEHGGDSSRGTGWANLKQSRCPECKGKGRSS